VSNSALADLRFCGLQRVAHGIRKIRVPAIAALNVIAG